MYTKDEIANIEAFCNNENMYNAVKKVILACIYGHGTIVKDEPKPDPLRNGAFALASLAIQNPIPDEVLGQHIRGQFAGINALELGFNELKTIKAEKEKPKEKVNPGI